MAWNYARYIGRVAEAGKAEYPIPMYVNAALSRTSSIAEAVGNGRRPSFAIGGPMADLLDVWRAGRAANRYPLARRLQRQGLRGVVRQVQPVREPAVHTRAEGWIGWRGQSDLRFRTPQCDRVDDHGDRGRRIPHPDHDLIGSFDMIAQMAPLIAQHQGNGTMSAVLLRARKDPPQKVRLGRLHAGSRVL